MPTYDYVCDACTHRFEHFQGISEPLLVACPACRKRRLRRLIGAGIGVVFKGSGFYETDYKRAPAGKDAGSASSSPKDASGPTGGAAASRDSGSSDSSGVKNGPPATKEPPAQGGSPGGAKGRAQGSSPGGSPGSSDAAGSKPAAKDGAAPARANDAPGERRGKSA